MIPLNVLEQGLTRRRKAVVPSLLGLPYLFNFCGSQFQDGDSYRLGAVSFGGWGHAAGEPALVYYGEEHGKSRLDVANTKTGAAALRSPSSTRQASDPIRCNEYRPERLEPGDASSSNK